MRKKVAMFFLTAAIVTLWLYFLSRGAYIKRSLILATVFVGGVSAVTASIFRWDWYFEDLGNPWIIKSFGRTGARYVHLVVGIMLTGAALWYVNERTFIGLLK
jgi:hypothetical protein